MAGGGGGGKESHEEIENEVGMMFRFEMFEGREGAGKRGRDVFECSEGGAGIVKLSFRT